MALAPGTRLGPYEVVAALGAGGMGEVYRARDTRLDRQVAIKILPPAFAKDPDRIGRFQREAKAVAALSHPNILAIHDVGVHENQGDATTTPTTYVVTEYLDGETLRERLRGGPMPIRKAVEAAVQIARGLAAAHDKGIIHRDVKPENIFVLADGQIKILDFGLARQTPADSGVTETAAVATDPGSVMGTVGYMAPEQVRGQAVDARTDLFALGAVLHEMLGGRKAFDRSTVADTLSAVLKEEPPDLITLRADVPPALDRIVRHSLEKNPTERFQSARDVAFALEALSGSTGAWPAADVGSPRRSGRARAAALIVAGVVMLAAIGVAAVRWPPSTTAGPAWTGALMGGPEIAMCPRLSPDGSMLAFIAMDGNMTQVAVMRPESGNWTILTHKRNAGYVVDLSWARDSNSIYFDRGSGVPMGVFSVPVVGGDEIQILEDAKSPSPLADGSLLLDRLNAERQLRLFRFWPETGRTQEFPIQPKADGFMTRAQLLRGDREAAVVGNYVAEGQPHGRHLYVVDLASGRVRLLHPGFDDDDSIGAIAVTPDGQSVIAVGSAGGLNRIVSVPANGAGVPHTLLTLTMKIFGLDAGPDGSIYADQADFPLAVVQFAPHGGHAEKIAGFSRTGLMGAVVLQDGRFVVPLAQGVSKRVMVIEPGKEARSLITTQENTSDPVTTVGASQVAFLIGSRSTPAIGLATIANGRITHRISFDKGPISSLASSADGQTLYVAAGGTIWSVPVEGGDPRAIRAGDSAVVDPLGQHLFVQVIETPRTRLFDVPLDGKPEREVPLNGSFQLTFDPLMSGSISKDGLLFVPLASPDDWFFQPGVVDLATGRMTRILVDHFGDYHALVRTLDGQILGSALDLRAGLWRFQPEKPR
jgi:hypothetical protein